VNCPFLTLLEGLPQSNAVVSSMDPDRRMKDLPRIPRLPLAKLGGTLALSFALGGCAGPPVLGQQVLGYDEVAKGLDEQLLLLNIARVDEGEGVHFTSASSIAATFDWTTTAGIGGQLNNGSASDFLNLNFGASASENPTFSIVPISGEEFTRRVVTPFGEEAFESLVFQGDRISQVMRLMAAGIEVQTERGSFVRFIENDPRRAQEYDEFRRVAMHLQWLNDNRKLFVRSLVFDETLVADFKGPLRPEDINSGFDKGLRWRQKPDGNFELTRPQAGRVIVANYDPMAMSDKERFELNERIRNNPTGFVHLDIRPGGPGGDMPIRGGIKLRSMYQILAFLARGIRQVPEHDVAPDPRTGAVQPDPTSTMAINVTTEEPRRGPPRVRYGGLYFSVNNTPWDRTSFQLLNALFQTTVGQIQNVGIPVTISK
jgi:hypothetical protein